MEDSQRVEQPTISPPPLAEVLGAPPAALPPAAALQGARPAAAPLMQVNGAAQSAQHAAASEQHAEAQAAAAAEPVPKADPLPGSAAAATGPRPAAPAAAAEAEAEAALDALCAEPEPRLRIEYFSNRGARTLSWLVFAASLVLLGATVALVCLKFISDQNKVLFKHKVWYTVNVSLAAVTVGSLLALAIKFWVNMRSTNRGQWNQRRLGLTHIAATMLGIQIVSSTFWLIPFSLTLAYDCVWFDSSIDGIAFVRWTAYNCFFTFCVCMAHACCRFRGPNPPEDPDEQLVMDISPAQKLRVHAPKLLLFLPFQAMVSADLYARLHDDWDAEADRAGCRGLTYSCASEPYAEVFNLLELILVGMYALVYAVYLRRAFKDHAALPYCRYRLSNMNIRMQVYYSMLVFGTIFLSIVVLSAIQYQSCWSYLDSSLGAMPVQLAMALLVGVNAFCMMPKNVATQDTVIALKQRFCWTQARLPAAMAERDAELRRAQGCSTGLQHLLSEGRRLVAQAAHAAEVVPGEVGKGLAELVNVKVDVLDRESMRQSKQQAKQSGQQQQQAKQSGQQQQQQQQEQQQQEQQQEQEQEQQQQQNGLQEAARQQEQEPEGQQQAEQWVQQAGWTEQQQGGQPGLPHKPRETEDVSTPPASPRAAARPRLDRGASLLRRLNSLPPWLHAGQQGERTAEPMFCLELAIRLFYWTKYAYRHWWGLENGGMSTAAALALFGLTGFEAIHDPGSDTRLLLGWKDGTLLLAFRGTASRANAATDLKFFRTTLEPRRYHHGQPAKVHSGFYHAYSACEERMQLLQRVADIVAGFTPGRRLQLYLTGHSLGGALCQLAAFTLQQVYPYADTAVVTFGAPRVGNPAFSWLYRSLVPNTFGVVNDQDPVPRVPTTGFRHCGLPVVINSRGDIIVRPSFFERSVIERTGGTVGHHKLQQYALSFAAVVKAQARAGATGCRADSRASGALSMRRRLPTRLQRRLPPPPPCCSASPQCLRIPASCPQFIPSKRLGAAGEAGAAALAQALDLSAVLAVRHLDLPSLRNPDLMPEPSRAWARKKRKKHKSLGGSSGWGSGSLSLFSLCSGAPEEEAVADDAEETAGVAEVSSKGMASSSDIEAAGSLEHAEEGEGEEGGRGGREHAGHLAVAAQGL
ncbi:hypothetical protein ABPG75_002949 [Micractinium tetrahymenae]